VDRTHSDGSLIVLYYYCIVLLGAGVFDRAGVPGAFVILFFTKDALRWLA
jgi:hypothetical protein